MLAISARVINSFVRINYNSGTSKLPKGVTSEMCSKECVVRNEHFNSQSLCARPSQSLQTDLQFHHAPHTRSMQSNAFSRSLQARHQHQHPNNTFYNQFYSAKTYGQLCMYLLQRHTDTAHQTSRAICLGALHSLFMNGCAFKLLIVCKFSVFLSEGGRLFQTCIHVAW